MKQIIKIETWPESTPKRIPESISLRKCRKCSHYKKGCTLGELMPCSFVSKKEHRNGLHSLLALTRKRLTRTGKINRAIQNQKSSEGDLTIVRL